MKVRNSGIERKCSLSAERPTGVTHFLSQCADNEMLNV